MDVGFGQHLGNLSYKFKLDLQPGCLTVQVAGEDQPHRKHPKALRYNDGLG